MIMATLSIILCILAFIHGSLADDCCQAWVHGTTGCEALDFATCTAEKGANAGCEWTCLTAAFNLATKDEPKWQEEIAIAAYKDEEPTTITKKKKPVFPAGKIDAVNSMKDSERMKVTDIIMWERTGDDTAVIRTLKFVPDFIAAIKQQEDANEDLLIWKALEAKVQSFEKTALDKILAKKIVETPSGSEKAYTQQDQYDEIEASCGRRTYGGIDYYPSKCGGAGGEFSKIASHRRLAVGAEANTVPTHNINTAPFSAAGYFQFQAVTAVADGGDGTTRGTCFGNGAVIHSSRIAGGTDAGKYREFILTAGHNMWEHGGLTNADRISTGIYFSRKMNIAGVRGTAHAPARTHRMLDLRRIWIPVFTAVGGGQARDYAVLEFAQPGGRRTPVHQTLLRRVNQPVYATMAMPTYRQTIQGDPHDADYGNPYTQRVQAGIVPDAGAGQLYIINPEYTMVGHSGSITVQETGGNAGRYVGGILVGDNGAGRDVLCRITVFKSKMIEKMIQGKINGQAQYNAGAKIAYRNMMRNFAHKSLQNDYNAAKKVDEDYLLYEEALNNQELAEQELDLAKEILQRDQAEMDRQKEQREQQEREQRARTQRVRQSRLYNQHQRENRFNRFHYSN